MVGAVGERIFVNDDVRTTGGDDVDVGLIAEVVLSSDGEMQYGGRDLCGNLDFLNRARSDGCRHHFQRFAFAFGEGDKRSFRSGDLEGGQSCNLHILMVDGHGLRHLGEDPQEGIAVGGEHGVGDVLGTGVRRP